MRFTETHEWITLDGSIGTVGITDYAQRELGEIVFIELPKVGQKIKAGQEIAVLESTKAAADTYAPVSGTVIEVNESLRSVPSAINQHPESAGWLFKIELTHPKELERLLGRDQYKSIVFQE
ncbi:MAG TPA: glycine cleavage system protein GcvH [Chlamydiales bacterium]|nr:glycine cleavage system protein GcvH [Chlamydiales bacterium]